jgi:hypothetical protein
MYKQMRNENMRIVIFILAVSSILLCVGQAKAVTFFDESFENGPLHSSGWTTDSCQYMGYSSPFPADGCNPTRSTDVSHSGAHSLKEDFMLPVLGGDGNRGVWITRTHTATTDVYYRFWVYTVNFIYEGGRTKGFYAGLKYPDFVVTNAWGSNQFSIDSQTEVGGVTPCNGTYTSCWYSPNIASVGINNNQWYCVEVHAKMNTLGQADGQVELWVNGIQTLGYYNRVFRDASGKNGIRSDADFDTVRIYTQAATGTRYFDDFAVGNTRIGCNSVLTSDITPPQAPGGLAVR